LDECSLGIEFLAGAGGFCLMRRRLDRLSFLSGLHVEKFEVRVAVQIAEVAPAPIHRYLHIFRKPERD
jgi:hypothetical protein